MKVRLDVYDGQYRNNVQRMTFYWTGLDCLGLHQFLLLHGSFQRHPIASAPVMSELVNQPDISPVRLEAYYTDGNAISILAFLFFSQTAKFKREMSTKLLD